MDNFQVVCFGQLLPGYDQALVQRNVAALFKASEAQVAPFFSGKRVVVKSGLTEIKAKQYQQALSKAGVEVHVEPLVAEPPKSVPSTPVPSKPVPSESSSAPPPKDTRQNATVDPTLTINDEYAVALTSQVDGQKVGDLQKASVAPAGTEFSTPKDVQAPALDLSHLSVSDQSDEPLEPEVRVQPKPIDISHLSLGD